MYSRRATGSNRTSPTASKWPGKKGTDNEMDEVEDTALWKVSSTSTLINIAQLIGPQSPH